MYPENWTHVLTRGQQMDAILYLKGGINFVFFWILQLL